MGVGELAWTGASNLIRVTVKTVLEQVIGEEITAQSHQSHTCFSQEYRRQFGEPPMRDVRRLRANAKRAAR